MRLDQTQPEIIAKLKNRITSSLYTVLVGLSKNAGKTSLLNWLLKHSKFDQPAVITTGRDGEELDLVGGHSKPKVELPANTFFTCFSSTLSANAPYIKIIGRTPFSALNRQLWLAQSLFPLKTEIVGPATVSKQIALADYILEKGANHIFIDGSLDRRSIATHPKIKELFLVAGAEYGDLQEISSELHKLHSLIDIPPIPNPNFSNEISYQLKGKQIQARFSRIYGHEHEITNWENAEFIYFPGALTDISFNKMKQFFCNYSGKLIFQHPFFLQLNEHNLNLLKKHTCLYCVNSIKIAAIAVNSFASNGKHLDCQHLRATLQSKFPELLIFDIKEVIYE